MRNNKNDGVLYEQKNNNEGHLLLLTLAVIVSKMWLTDHAENLALTREMATMGANL